MQADKEWVDVIRQTLDNYQEEYQPGAWERFDQKRKLRKRVIFLSWGSALAASLVIGFFAAGWLLQHNNTNQPVELTRAEQIKNEPTFEFKNDSSVNISVSNSMKNVKAATRMAENKASATNSTLRVNAKSNNHEIINEDLIANRDENANQPVKSNSGYETLTIDTTQQHIALNNQSIDSNANISKKEMRTIDQKSIDSALNAYTAPLADIPDDDDKTKERRVRFGVNVAPGVNATQSAAAMNYGGGVNTDISLFANIQLSTGLQIEQQNINTSNQGGNSPASEMHAEMLTLDLPVNLTWQFYSGKNHSYYLSGGVSSLAYLDQKYENTSYELKIGELNSWEGAKYEMTQETTTTETEVEPLETFNWGGRINFAFGFQQQLTNKLYFHVEPYVKVPVNGLGAEKIKYTTSGISCKVSF